MDEKEQQVLVAELSPEETAFLDRMLEQLKQEGYEGLTREELIGIIVKATKESGINIGELLKKLE